MPCSGGEAPYKEAYKRLTQVKNEDEARFASGVICLVDVPGHLREITLAKWDLMLERLKLDWAKIDFDIAGHLEYNREMAEAA